MITAQLEIDLIAGVQLRPVPNRLRDHHLLDWNRDGEITRIIDVATQPVASAEIARLLLELATAEAAADTELAGPQVEQLVDQVRQLVAYRGENISVEAIPAPASMAAGSMLPGPSALTRGPSWNEWLTQT